MHSTILAAAGLGAEATDGLDLATLLESGSAAGRTLFAHTGRSFFAQNPRREIDGLAGYWTSIRRGNLKLIHIPTREGADLETIKGEVLAEIEKLKRDGPTDAELLRVQASVEAGFLQRQESVWARADLVNQ